MKTYTNYRVKAIQFWKRNKKRILIGIIIFLIILIINNILKNMPKKLPSPSISYKPHVTVLTDKEVPKKYQKPIENLVDTYFNYCNNGEYENAYNLITDDCKKACYPTLEQFTGYVNHVFEGKKKIYSLQSYSIVNNIYVYQIKILDDFLATGTSEGYYYYEEKLILKEENGEMKLSIGEFISQDQPHIAVEDEYMKVEIFDRTVDYETETYRIKVTNKSDSNYIVIADGDQNNEVQLNLGSRKDNPSKVVDSFIVKPNSFRFETITFNKFYDDGNTSQGIYFGAVRILNNYDYSVGTTQEVLDSALKLYAMEIPLQ